MGLDYSYRLFFPRDRLRAVLRAVADFADNSAGHDRIDLVFPDGATLTLPFSSSYGAGEAQRDWADRSRPIRLADGARSLQFNTVLRFAPDGEVERYLRETAEAIREESGEAWTAPRDSRGRPAIGYVFLDVDLAAEGAGAGAIRFDFTAATTRMSELFARSASVRAAFVGLLEEHGGLSGWFDDEAPDGLGQRIWPAPGEGEPAAPE